MTGMTTKTKHGLARLVCAMHGPARQVKAGDSRNRGCEMQGTESLPIPSRPGPAGNGNARHGRAGHGWASQGITAVGSRSKDQIKSRCGIGKMTRNGKQGR